ncbi:MAG: hypothetical protein JSW00_14760 [Thermoplasmata archaeon]|nr:MAG: hypothetical protein JSW00_14760 [Thermoplasmata archaeon]
MTDFEPAFFFEVKFSAVVENNTPNTKYVFHYTVEDSKCLDSISVHHDGSGSQRNLGKSKISRGLEKHQFFIGTWGKKKLALTCSNFTYDINAPSAIRRWETD